jgi:hypothetical protein
LDGRIYSVEFADGVAGLGVGGGGYGASVQDYYVGGVRRICEAAATF